jgi:hypothetical protein
MSIPASFPALTRGFLARSKKLELNFLSGVLDPRITFARSTVATVTDFEGVIKNTKINEARFDGMRRVENLLTYSQAIGGATGWSSPDVTATLNNISAPDATITASQLNENATTNTHYVGTTSATAIISGKTYIFSAYLKKGIGATAPQYVQFNAFSGAFNCGVVVDLNAGTIYSTLYIGGATVSSSSSESKGNGWYKYTFTAQAIANASGLNAPAIVFINNNPALASAGSAPTYLGATTSDVYCWGAQLENVTGQTNQNPSEYISTNVLSYPYQGAGVDGVQYFPYTNPNCIINGAITQIPTVSINSSNSKFTYGTTASGDYFSTPSSAVNQITGDLSLLVQIALDDWTPTTVQTLVAKDGVSAGTRSWAFNIQTSGALRLNYSLDGTNIISVTASASTGFTDGTVHYVGVQREASTGIVRFYTSENGSTFTLLGTQQTGASGSLYNASSTAVQFGNLSSLTFALDGKIYDSHVYNGLKFTGTSTMVMDFDPSNWTSGSTFTGLETGEVWTLNGNTKIYQGLWDAVGPKCMLIEEARTNVFLNSTAPATQSYTTSATPYTISFYGLGSITLSGSYVAVVTGSNALTRTTLTFTPTALPLVMTVAGTITKPQLEAGRFATSYIETAGSQVTRNADQASMTGTNFSSWYNQSQGAIYWEGDQIYNTVPAKIAYFWLLYNSSTYRTELNQTGNLNQYAEIRYNQGSANNSLSSTLIPVNTKAKFMTSFINGSFSNALNGAVTNTITSVTIPTNITSLYIGSAWVTGYELNGHIRTLRYYSVALPSATLQALTS